jgi:hypothetical protein
VRKVAACAAMIALIACARQPPPNPQPQPSPAPTASAPAPAPPTSATPTSVPPTAIPTPIGTPTIPPTAQPTPSPAPPTPSPAYRFVYTPPPEAASAAPSAPRILEIDMTDQVVHQNSDVALRVVTNLVVATVIASAMGRDAPIPQVGSGVFAAQSHIPGVPFFLLNRTYSIQIRAATPDGQIASVTLPIRLVR